MKRASWGRVLVGSDVGDVVQRCVALLAVGMIVAAALSAASASAAVIYPPRLSAAVRTAEGFELRGTVYDYGGTTTYHFEYGTTTAYGTIVPIPDAEAGTALASSMSQVITGLAADTVYHYRLVSTNSVEGTGTSEDGTFSTAITPTTPPPTTGGGAGQTPPGQTYPGQGGEGTAPAHRSERLHRDLASAHRRRRRRAEGPGGTGHDQAPRGHHPGHLPRPAALHLCRRQEARPGQKATG